MPTNLAIDDRLIAKRKNWAATALKKTPLTPPWMNTFAAANKPPSSRSSAPSITMPLTTTNASAQKSARERFGGYLGVVAGLAPPAAKTEFRRKNVSR